MLQVMVEMVVDATMSAVLRTALQMMQSMSQLPIGGWSSIIICVQPLCSQALLCHQI